MVPVTLANAGPPTKIGVPVALAAASRASAVSAYKVKNCCWVPDQNTGQSGSFQISKYRTPLVVISWVAISVTSASQLAVSSGSGGRVSGATPVGGLATMHGGVAKMMISGCACASLAASTMASSGPAFHCPVVQS